MLFYSRLVWLWLSISFFRHIRASYVPAMWCREYSLWLYLCYSCRCFLLHEMHILHSCCVFTALLHILHALLWILLGHCQSLICC